MPLSLSPSLLLHKVYGRQRVADRHSEWLLGIFKSHHLYLFHLCYINADSEFENTAISTSRHSKATVAAVIFACFMVQTGLGFGYIFSVTLKHIVSEFDWSRTAFAMASSSMLICMALASPVVGRLTEVIGARWVASVSVLLLGLAMYLFSQMQSLWQFIAINVLFGLGMTGVGDIVAGSVASAWVSGRRGLSLGLVYTGSNVGGMLVPVLAQQLAADVGWREALQSLGLGAVIVILPVALFLLKEPPKSSVVTGGAGLVRNEDEGSLTLSEAVKTRSFWLLMYVLFSFYFYYLAINQHVVAYLSDSGFSDATAAASFSMAVGVGIFGKLAIGWFADQSSCKTAMLANFALLALASVLLLQVNLPMVLPAFLFIHGFATAAENVLLPLMVAACFGVRHMATIYGVLMLMLLPGGVLGPIVAAYSFDTLGAYDWAFNLFSLLNVLALLAVFLLRNERMDTGPPGVSIR